MSVEIVTMVSAVGGAGSRRIGRAVAKPSSASTRAGAPGGLAQVYHRAGPSLDPAAQLILHNITARTHATPVGLLAVPYRRNALSGLEWDDFSSNRHPALPYCWSVIFSENRAHFSGSCSRRDARTSREGRKSSAPSADNRCENGIIIRHACGVFLEGRPMMALQVLADITA